jgi:hypothetical protein
MDADSVHIAGACLAALFEVTVVIAKTGKPAQARDRRELGLAFFEYLVQVPAYRIRSDRFSGGAAQSHAGMLHHRGLYDHRGTLVPAGAAREQERLVLARGCGGFTFHFAK